MIGYGEYLKKGPRGGRIMSCTIPTCTSCKYFKTKGVYPEPEFVCYCDAFPNGIPDEWFWKGNPEEVDECNNGIKFEKITNYD